MTGLDVLLIALMCVLALVGVLKGLTRLLIGIGTLVCGIALAAQFHEVLAQWIGDRVSWSGPVCKMVAYAAIFLATMLAGGLLAFFMRRLLRAAMLTWADRVAGAAAGFVAAILMGALLILPVVAYAPFGEGVLKNSVLAPYVTVVADLANGLMPGGLSEQYRQRVEALRVYWHERWASAS